MEFVAIIPARYASTRFPGKPLAMLGGKPVIRRVYEQVTGVLPDAVVATDDERILRAVEEFGGRAVMTSSEHRSGTDRCWEAYGKLGREYDAVINVQGDEPFIRPEQFRAIMRCFDVPGTDIATLVRPFAESDGLAALENPNSPKVVLDGESRAIYFSRSVIPYLRGVERSEWLAIHTFYKHIGMYEGARRGDGLAAIFAGEGRVARTVALAGERLQDRRGYLRRGDHRHRHARRSGGRRGIFETNEAIESWIKNLSL